MAAHCGFDVEVNFGQQKVAERLQQALGDFLERAPESQDAVAAILFCQSQMQAVAVQQLQEQMAGLQQIIITPGTCGRDGWSPYPFFKCPLWRRNTPRIGGCI